MFARPPHLVALPHHNNLRSASLQMSARRKTSKPSRRRLWLLAPSAWSLMTCRLNLWRSSSSALSSVCCLARFHSRAHLNSKTGNAIYEDRYLLGTSLARPVIARALVRAAHKYNCNILSHGCVCIPLHHVRRALVPPLPRGLPLCGLAASAAKLES